MSKPRGRWGERCPARQGASRAQRTPLAAGAPVVSRPISPVAEVAEVGEVGDVGGGCSGRDDAGRPIEGGNDWRLQRSDASLTGMRRLGDGVERDEMESSQAAANSAPDLISPSKRGTGEDEPDRFLVTGLDTLDLADRHALRRVPGLATELEDISEVEYRRLRLERVVLIGVWTRGTLEDAETSMAELAALAETAGSQVLDALIQRRGTPDPATYVGSGKAKELRDIVAATGADTVICDGELVPGQLRQLENVVKVKVVDRTALILDIFAQHARSREGKAQVELAQLSYMLPRLRGWGESLSRTGGGIGTRGPGETKIETDRRRIRARMSRLRREIHGMGQVRETKRSVRAARQVPAVAIVGYTNAGKSSLLNRLTGARVLVEDALFATLDTTVRRARAGDGREYTLADTVGFVRHLPHQLVEAFRSTLEEVAEADLLAHVVDGSHGDPEAQIDAVRTVLGQIGAQDVPEIVVVNKADAADPRVLDRLRRVERCPLVVSARTGEGLPDLAAAIEAALPRPAREVRALVPYARGDLVARAYRTGEVLSEEHVANGTLLHARVEPELAADLGEYAAKAAP